MEFIDTVGNAYINRPPCLVWVKGQRPAEGIAGATEVRAFGKAGLAVVFVLLCRLALATAPYRRIADAAGVAHGTVGAAVTELRQGGFLGKLGGKRRLLAPERLLGDWAQAYVRNLRPRLLLGRFRTDRPEPLIGMNAGDFDYRFGGEVAEARTTGYLRPAGVTLYGGRPGANFLGRFRLRPDPEGAVELLQRFWHFPMDDTDVVPLPLVYADLIATTDPRCLEAAERVRKGIVDGFERP